MKHLLTRINTGKNGKKNGKKMTMEFTKKSYKKRRVCKNNCCFDGKKPLKKNERDKTITVSGKKAKKYPFLDS